MPNNHHKRGPKSVDEQHPLMRRMLEVAQVDTQLDLYRELAKHFREPAKRIHMLQQQWTRGLKPDGRFPEELVDLVARTYGARPEWLLTGQGEPYDTVRPMASYAPNAGILLDRFRRLTPEQRELCLRVIGLLRYYPDGLEAWCLQREQDLGRKVAEGPDDDTPDITPIQGCHEE